MRTQIQIDAYLINAKYSYCRLGQDLQIMRTYTSVINETPRICDDLSVAGGMIRSIEQSGLNLWEKNILVDKLIGMGYLNRSGDSPYVQDGYCNNYVKL